MDMEPTYSVYWYDEYTRYLQIQAICDIMGINPIEKQARLATYGLSPSCKEVVWAVLRGMNEALLKWAARNNVHLSDLHMPLFRPEAFRLETGCTIWPNPGHVAVLMPMSAGAANIALMPRGTNYLIHTLWEPGLVLFLNETAFRFTGTGGLRFIYISLQKIALPPQETQFRPYLFQSYHA